MSVKLVIKNVKPYKIINPEIDGKKLPASFGIKVYNTTDSEVLQKDFKELIVNEELELANAKLIKWNEEGDKAEEDFYSIRKDLQTTVETLAKDQEAKIYDFYRSQVLFAQGISTTIIENGKEKDFIVSDSRTTPVIESLWATPEECLVVLLDAYFDVPALRDSLTSKILEVIFNKYSEGKLGNLK